MIHSLSRNYAVRAREARPLGRRNVRPAWGGQNFCAAFLGSPNGEPRYPFTVFGAVAAGGRFCGLKAALLLLCLHSHGLGQPSYGLGRLRLRPGARLGAEHQP